MTPLGDSGSHDPVTEHAFRRPWLVIAALTFAAALLIAPGLRWLFAAQARTALPARCTPVLASLGGMLSNPCQDEVRRDEGAVAAGRPADAAVQVAVAFGTEPGVFGRGPETIARLRALQARMPGNPVLHAVLLQAQAHLLSPEMPVTDTRMWTGRPWRPPSMAVLAAFDRDAADGERLDPANAFFPAMRAAELFTAGKQLEALAAVRRAGAAGTWNTYQSELALAQWRVLAALPDGRSALVLLDASFDTPMFAGEAILRSLARAVAAVAAQEERAGRTADARRLRVAVARLGVTMSTRSKGVIGFFTGAVVAEVAMARAGGDVRITPNRGNRGVLWKPFAAYLTRTGDGTGGRAFITAGNQLAAAHAILARGIPRDDLLNLLRRLDAWWSIDLIALSNVIWLLVMGALCGLLSTLPAVRTGRAPSPCVRWAAIRGCVCGILVAPAVHASAGWVAALVVGAAALALVPLLRSGGAEGRHARLVATGLSAVVFAALSLAFPWQTRYIHAPIYDALSLRPGGDWIAWVVARSGSLLVPLVLVFVSAALSWRLRVPVSVGVARSVRGTAVPAACLIFIAYGAAFVPTLRAEAAAGASLRGHATNECRYFARLAGMQWPW